MNPAELRGELDRAAHEQGFAAVAVAEATALERDAARLADWLAQGRQAGMQWMQRYRRQRADPRELLVGCRSVVTLLLNYGPGRAVGEPGGRVARYARGRDYHRVMRAKLVRLAQWLEERTGAAARTCVDTGPVLERAWAERSGLGWIGKNANLLTRGLGSWVLLGEVLTTARIAADPGPHADLCGSCTACLDGCPTGAIVEPGVVDSNACISYWTIEHRGPIPAGRREAIADLIFGCDVCQEVCPWNRSFARPTEDPALGLRQDLEALDPERILALDEGQFRARFSGTALMRAKWEGLRRNACIVLGNLGRREALPALERALGDPDEVVRSHAAWAIERIRGS
jgi:epoxyqueuosine reductase